MQHDRRPPSSSSSYRRRGARVVILLAACGALITGAGTAQAATYTVSSTADAGPGSLRAAVALTNAGAGNDTIVLPSSTSAYILTSGELVVSRPLSLIGGGARTTTVSGNSSSRILNYAVGAQTGGVNTVSGLTLTAGRSPSAGGAILIGAGALTLTSVAMTQNVATGRGGAVAIGGSGSSSNVLSVSESSFSGNRSAGSGGAIAAGGGGVSGDTLTITSSLFADNTTGTGEYGGAVSTGGGGDNTDTVTINNTTIVSNTAPGTASRGGGLWVSAKIVRLADNTIDDNEAGTGGGIATRPDAVLVNTIVANNRGAALATNNCDGTVTSGGSNLESGSSCGFTSAGDRRGVDPLLGPVQDNGGPTATQMPLPGSPAVDAGNAAVGPPADQRGIPRPQGPATDIGAVEVAPATITPTSVTAVTAGSAVVEAFAENPSAAAAATRFEYGPTTAYGAQVAAATVAPRAGRTALRATLAGLPPGSVLHVRAVVDNADRTSFGPDQAFTTAAAPLGAMPGPGPAGPAPGAAAPVLRGLAVAPPRVRTASGPGPSVGAVPRGRGATLTYTDSQAARTTFTVLRVQRGYRVAGRCRPTRPRSGTVRRCTRNVSVGSFSRTDVAGANRVRFTGRVRGRGLAAGSYALRAVARRDGRSSATARASFTVVRR